MLASCSDDKPSTDAAVDAGSEVGTDAASDSKLPETCTVMTKSGPVEGKVSSGHCAFLDIPYAAPPVGNLRWKPPEPPAPWTSPHDATKFGPSCSQYQANFAGVPTGPVDEDCLTLAVWTPPLGTTKKAPVMVSLHIGVFINGGKSGAVLNGAPLAVKQGVVVVGINYRLGPLGQMAHPKLGNEMVNFGLLDQQAALSWVKDNIAAFGGDPDNVTIFGSSAGGISVCHHIVSPKSKGLFHRAIAQSGSCLTAPTRADAEAYGQRVSKAVGCDTAADEVACLRAASAQDLAIKAPAELLLQYGAEHALWPFVDGVTLLEQPKDTLASGNFNKVPLLTGSNANEATIVVAEEFLVPQPPRTLDAAGYTALLENLFSPADAAKVVAQYDPASFGNEPIEALAAAMTDSIFTCPTRRLARAMAGAGQPVYLYHFAHTPAVLAALDAFYRATNGAEVPFVYGTQLLTPPTQDERKLSDTMMGYWARFAKTGDPNDTSATTWPKYSETDEKHLELTLTPAAKGALKQAECNFWQGFSEL
ncbi:MAG: carboxylesterase family protein [Myxococcales bacterium]|nr:carboxylesterase family protein [Myxococcales bacterium]